MNRIHFVFAGPSKTASTWLFNALKEHPAFSLPPSKDIYFFDQFYDRGVDWYHEQFAQCDFSLIVGEFSHDYLMNEIALRRLAEYNPSIKVMVCLRNPYQRTESGIRFLRRNGYGFENLPTLVRKHPELIQGSLYGQNLQRLLRYFPSEQLLLLDFDDLQYDPGMFLDAVWRFFAVEPIEPSNIRRKDNVARAARSRTIAFAIKQIALFARRVGLGSLVGQIKMNRAVLGTLYRPAGDAPVLTHSELRLLAEQFEPDLDKLSALTGLDYKRWRCE